MSSEKSSHSCLVLLDARCFWLTLPNTAREFTTVTQYGVAALHLFKVKHMLMCHLFILSFKAKLCCLISPKDPFLLHVPFTSYSSSTSPKLFKLSKIQHRKVANLTASSPGTYKTLLYHISKGVFSLLFILLLTYKPHFFRVARQNSKGWN